MRMCAYVHVYTHARVNVYARVQHVHARVHARVVAVAPHLW